MRKTAILCILLLLFTLSAGLICAEAAAPAPELEDLVQTGADSFSCTFDGVKHSFLLELPEDPAGAPLVLMLPGYGNTAEAFRTQTHFETEANARGYAVAYVTGAPDPNVRTSSVGWHSELDTAGNRDVEFLVALKDYLQDAFSLDRERAFAVGFSNGAMMTHCLAMEAGESFTAFVSVGGPMPKSVWDARREHVNTGFFQITGEKDEVVPKYSDGSARFAKAPAIEDVMAYWVSANGLELLETSEIGRASVLTKYGSGEASRQVWDLFVANGHHSWPSVSFHQIDINTLILDFFEAQG